MQKKFHFSKEQVIQWFFNKINSDFFVISSLCLQSTIIHGVVQHFALTLFPFTLLSLRQLRQLLCKSLYSFVLFCSIVMRNGVIIYYLLYYYCIIIYYLLLCIGIIPPDEWYRIRILRLSLGIVFVQTILYFFLLSTKIIN